MLLLPAACSVAFQVSEPLKPEIKREGEPSLPNEP